MPEGEQPAGHPDGVAAIGVGLAVEQRPLAPAQPAPDVERRGWCQAERDRDLPDAVGGARQLDRQHRPDDRPTEDADDAGEEPLAHEHQQHQEHGTVLLELGE